jgi:hypothetical protein
MITYPTNYLPEQVAEETRQSGGTIPDYYLQQILSTLPPGQQILGVNGDVLAMVSSPSGGRGPYLAIGTGFDPPPYDEMPLAYQGFGTPQTSQPGVTIAEEMPEEGQIYEDVYIDLTEPGDEFPSPEEEPIYEDVYIDLTFPVGPEDVASDVTNAVTSQINNELEQVEQSRSQLESAIQGQQTYVMDQVEPSIGKPLGRIENQLQTMLGDAIGGGYQVGIGLPTIDQIISGEPVYSPYGIGPYMEQPPYQPQTGGGYPTGYPGGVYQGQVTGTYQEPYQPTGDYQTGGGYPTSYPGAAPSCPAPVVQCPAPAPPAPITFSPVINVNVPKTGEPDVTYRSPEDTEETTYEPECPVCPEPEPCPVYEPSPEELEPEPEPEEETAPEEEQAPEDTEPEIEPFKPAGTGSFENPPVGGMWGSTAACGFSSGGLDRFWAYSLLGYTNVGTSAARAPAWIESLNQLKVIGPALARTADNIFTGMAGFLSASLPSGSIEVLPKVGGALVARFVAGVVDKYVGGESSYLTQGYKYDINYHFPTLIPSEADFVQMFLGNAIDEQTLECMVRANGSYYSWYKLLASVNRTKPSIDQVISLNRRGAIADETAQEYLRQNGVTNNFDAGLFYKATEAVPTVSDIVRFMVRDADDNQVAEKYGTDSNLNTKYGDQLKAWARSQGITDDVMKYYWRSHWDIPSNTALFEMYHRLRPKRAAGDTNPEVVTTEKDIEDALIVNDMLPFWAKRMLAISFRPLTRTDAQRAFFIDAISEAELFDVYMDLGYKSEDARRLVNFTNQLKKKRAQGAGSAEKPVTTLKYFRNYIISRQEAFGRLQAGGLSEAQSNEALNIAETQRRNESTLVCLKGIKAAFKKLALDDFTVRDKILGLGIPPENVEPIVAQWKCERSSKPKYLTAAQACKLRKEDLISEEEYKRRLGSLGYDEMEAELISQLCQNPAFAPKGRGKKAAAAAAPVDGMKQTEAARSVIAAAAQLAP